MGWVLVLGFVAGLALGVKYHRKSARRYDEATKAFVESGKVKEHADTTATISSEEKRELGEAEKAGKERAKEEDPAVRRDYSEPE
jgi:hypothetical protein